MLGSRSAKKRRRSIGPSWTQMTHDVQNLSELFSNAPQTERSREDDEGIRLETANRSLGIESSNEREGNFKRSGESANSSEPEGALQENLGNTSDDSDEELDEEGDSLGMDGNLSDHDLTWSNEQSVEDPVDTADDYPDPTKDFTGDEDSLGANDERHGSLRKELIRKAKRMLRWETLLGISVACGSVKFTVEHYETMRSVISAFNKDISTTKKGTNLPSYSKLKRSVLKHLMGNCFPRASIYRYQLNFREIYPREMAPLRLREFHNDLNMADEDESRSNQSPQETGNSASVYVIKPSEWARMDMAMPKFYSAITNATKEDDHIDQSDIVLNRERILCPTHYIFVRSGSQTVRAGVGAVIKMRLNELPTKMRRIPPDNIEYIFGGGDTSGEDKYEHAIEGEIAATWCVGALGSPTPSALHAIRGLFGVERAIAEALRHAKPREGDETTRTTFISSDQVIPGDMCTLLRPTLSSFSDDLWGKTHYRCVLVHRFWCEQAGEATRRLVWLRVQGINDGEEQQWEVKVRLRGSQLVYNAVHLVSNPLHERFPGACPRSFGTLAGSNSPYAVYRIMLYCDDFKASTSLLPKGSAGGCYLLPLGLPPNWRNKRSAVRLIGLTPPGVSTNEILLEVIEDLAKMTSEGVDGINPDGEKLKIFVDVVGFIADYPAVSHVIDCMGHNATAPCSLCTFRRQTEEGGVSYSYSSSIHSESSAHLRSWERHDALRSSGIEEKGTKWLGMRKPSDMNRSLSPLVELRKALNECREKIPLNVEGQKVVSGAFDEFRSTVVAPDHLLTGLAINVLNLCFALLPSNESRSRIDVALCASLRENGLIAQSQIYNLQKKELFSMSLSAVYAVLTVASQRFRNFVNLLQSDIDNTLSRSLKLMEDLQEIVSKSFWWPIWHVDGKTSVEQVRGRGKGNWNQSLQKLSQRYVESVQEIVDLSTGRKKKLCMVLEKPNLHRFVELFRHSIQCYGHIRQFAELVFEAAHQPLKRSVVRSNHHRQYLSAVEHVLANDWQGRISLLHLLLQKGGHETRSIAFKCLLRLFLGNQVEKLDPRHESDSEFNSSLCEMAEKMFIPEIRKLLRSNGKVSFSWYGGKRCWDCTEKLKDLESTINFVGRKVVVHNIVQILQPIIDSEIPPAAAHNQFNGEEEEKLAVFRKARRVRTVSGEIVGSCYGHDYISYGCVVQALIMDCSPTDPLLFPCSSDDLELIQSGTPTVHYYFAVVTIVQGNTEHPLAAVIRCDQEGNKLRTSNTFNLQCLQLLVLTDGVRRVGIYHDCDSRCIVDARKKTVLHSSDIFEGGWFLFQRRYEGYPPRQA